MLVSVSRTCARLNNTHTRIFQHAKTARSYERSFTVLALESSADDTCAAVVTSDRKILSNVVSKQHAYHAKYNGIEPYVAIKAHQKHMPMAVRQALSDAKLSVHDVDGIAFTRGPGMAGCLAVCSNAAKTLAAAVNKPLVGVHHMQAHALTVLLTTPEAKQPQYPFLTLLVSGGHTLLLLATSPTSFKTLATTVDMSIGRALDMMSARLGLSNSPNGLGAALETFCMEGKPDIPLPPDALHLDVRPAISGQLAFSYSGLQTPFRRYMEKCGGAENMDEDVKRAVARAFQNSLFRQLEAKLIRGLYWCGQRGVDVRHLVVSGGVASNMLLRSRLRAALEKASADSRIELLVPPPALCTDNAVMIAWASMDRFLKGEYDDYSVELLSVWDIEDLEKRVEPAI